jgi:hypothetical protein
MFEIRKEPVTISTKLKKSSFFINLASTLKQKLKSSTFGRIKGILLQDLLQV